MNDRSDRTGLGLKNVGYKEVMPPSLNAHPTPKWDLPISVTMESMGIATSMGSMTPLNSTHWAGYPSQSKSIRAPPSNSKCFLMAAKCTRP